MSSSPASSPRHPTNNNTSNNAVAVSPVLLSPSKLHENWKRLLDERKAGAPEARIIEMLTRDIAVEFPVHCRDLHGQTFTSIFGDGEVLFHLLCYSVKYLQASHNPSDSARNMEYLHIIMMISMMLEPTAHHNAEKHKAIYERYLSHAVQSDLPSVLARNVKAFFELISMDGLVEEPGSPLVDLSSLRHFSSMPGEDLTLLRANESFTDVVLASTVGSPETNTAVADRQQSGLDQQQQNASPFASAEESAEPQKKPLLHTPFITKRVSSVAIRFATRNLTLLNSLMSPQASSVHVTVRNVICEHLVSLCNSFSEQLKHPHPAAASIAAQVESLINATLMRAQFPQSHIPASQVLNAAVTSLARSFDVAKEEFEKFQRFQQRQLLRAQQRQKQSSGTAGNEDAEVEDEDEDDTAALMMMLPRRDSVDVLSTTNLLSAGNAAQSPPGTPMKSPMPLENRALFLEQQRRQFRDQQFKVFLSAIRSLRPILSCAVSTKPLPMDLESLKFPELISALLASVPLTQWLSASSSSSFSSPHASPSGGASSSSSSSSPASSSTASTAAAAASGASSPFRAGSPNTKAAHDVMNSGGSCNTGQVIAQSILSAVSTIATAPYQPAPPPLAKADFAGMRDERASLLKSKSGGGGGSGGSFFSKFADTIGNAIDAVTGKGSSDKLDQQQRHQDPTKKLSSPTTAAVNDDTRVRAGSTTNAPATVVTVPGILHGIADFIVQLDNRDTVLSEKFSDKLFGWIGSVNAAGDLPWSMRSQLVFFLLDHCAKITSRLQVTLVTSVTVLAECGVNQETIANIVMKLAALLSPTEMCLTYDGAMATVMLFNSIIRGLGNDQQLISDLVRSGFGIVTRVIEHFVTSEENAACFRIDANLPGASTDDDSRRRYNATLFALLDEFWTLLLQAADDENFSNFCDAHRAIVAFLRCSIAPHGITTSSSARSMCRKLVGKYPVCCAHVVSFLQNQINHLASPSSSSSTTTAQSTTMVEKEFSTLEPEIELDPAQDVANDTLSQTLIAVVHLLIDTSYEMPSNNNSILLQLQHQLSHHPHENNGSNSNIAHFLKEGGLQVAADAFAIIARDSGNRLRNGTVLSCRLRPVSLLLSILAPQVRFYSEGISLFMKLREAMKRHDVEHSVTAAQLLIDLATMQLAIDPTENIAHFCERKLDPEEYALRLARKSAEHHHHGAPASVVASSHHHSFTSPASSLRKPFFRNRSFGPFMLREPLVAGSDGPTQLSLCILPDVFTELISWYDDASGSATTMLSRTATPTAANPQAAVGDGGAGGGGENDAATLSEEKSDENKNTTTATVGPLSSTSVSFPATSGSNPPPPPPPAPFLEPAVGSKPTDLNSGIMPHLASLLQVILEMTERFLVIPSQHFALFAARHNLPSSLLPKAIMTDAVIVNHILKNPPSRDVGIERALVAAENSVKSQAMHLIGNGIVTGEVETPFPPPRQNPEALCGWTLSGWYRWSFDSSRGDYQSGTQCIRLFALSWRSPQTSRKCLVLATVQPAKNMPGQQQPQQTTSGTTTPAASSSSTATNSAAQINKQPSTDKQLQYEPCRLIISVSFGNGESVQQKYAVPMSSNGWCHLAVGRVRYPVARHKPPPPSSPAQASSSRRVLHDYLVVHRDGVKCYPYATSMTECDETATSLQSTVHMHELYAEIEKTLDETNPKAAAVVAATAVSANASNAVVGAGGSSGDSVSPASSASGPGSPKASFSLTSAPSMSSLLGSSSNIPASTTGGGSTTVAALQEERRASTTISLTLGNGGNRLDGFDLRTLRFTNVYLIAKPVTAGMAVALYSQRFVSPPSTRASLQVYSHRPEDLILSTALSENAVRAADAWCRSGVPVSVSESLPACWETTNEDYIVALHPTVAVRRQPPPSHVGDCDVKHWALVNITGTRRRPREPFSLQGFHSIPTVNRYEFSHRATCLGGMDTLVRWLHEAIDCEHVENIVDVLRILAIISLRVDYSRCKDRTLWQQVARAMTKAHLDVRIVRAILDIAFVDLSTSSSIACGGGGVLPSSSQQQQSHTAEALSSSSAASPVSASTSAFASPQSSVVPAPFPAAPSSSSAAASPSALPLATNTTAAFSPPPPPPPSYANALVVNVALVEQALLQWELIAHKPDWIAEEITRALSQMLSPTNPHCHFNANRLYRSQLMLHLSHGVARHCLSHASLVGTGRVMSFALHCGGDWLHLSVGRMLAFVMLTVPFHGDEASLKTRLFSLMPIKGYVDVVRNVVLRAFIDALGQSCNPTAAAQQQQQDQDHHHHRRGQDIFIPHSTTETENLNMMNCSKLLLSVGHRCPPWLIAFLISSDSTVETAALALRLLERLVLLPTFRTWCTREGLYDALSYRLPSLAHHSDILATITRLALGAKPSCYAQPYDFLAANVAVSGSWVRNNFGIPNTVREFMPLLWKMMDHLTATAVSASSPSDFPEHGMQHQSLKKYFDKVSNLGYERQRQQHHYLPHNHPHRRHRLRRTFRAAVLATRVVFRMQRMAALKTDESTVLDQMDLTSSSSFSLVNEDGTLSGTQHLQQNSSSSKGLVAGLSTTTATTGGGGSSSQHHSRVGSTSSATSMQQQTAAATTAATPSTQPLPKTESNSSLPTSIADSDAIMSSSNNNPEAVVASLSRRRLDTVQRICSLCVAQCTYFPEIVEAMLEFTPAGTQPTLDAITRAMHFSAERLTSHITPPISTTALDEARIANSEDEDQVLPIGADDGSLAGSSNSTIPAPLLKRHMHLSDDSIRHISPESDDQLFATTLQLLRKIIDGALMMSANRGGEAVVSVLNYVLTRCRVFGPWSVASSPAMICVISIVIRTTLSSTYSRLAKLKQQRSDSGESKRGAVANMILPVVTSCIQLLRYVADRLTSGMLVPLDAFFGFACDAVRDLHNLGSLGTDFASLKKKSQHILLDCYLYVCSSSFHRYSRLLMSRVRELLIGEKNGVNNVTANADAYDQTKWNEYVKKLMPRFFELSFDAVAEDQAPSARMQAATMWRLLFNSAGSSVAFQGAIKSIKDNCTMKVDFQTAFKMFGDKNLGEDFFVEWLADNRMAISFGARAMAAGQSAFASATFQQGPLRLDTCSPRQHALSVYRLSTVILQEIQQQQLSAAAAAVSSSSSSSSTAANNNNSVQQQQQAAGDKDAGSNPLARKVDMWIARNREAQLEQQTCVDPAVVNTMTMTPLSSSASSSAATQQQPTAAAAAAGGGGVSSPLSPAVSRAASTVSTLVGSPSMTSLTTGAGGGDAAQQQQHHRYHSVVRAAVPADLDSLHYTYDADSGLVFRSKLGMENLGIPFPALTTYVGGGASPFDVKPGLTSSSPSSSASSPNASSSKPPILSPAARRLAVRLFSDERAEPLFAANIYALHGQDYVIAVMIVTQCEIIVVSHCTLTAGGDLQLAPQKEHTADVEQRDQSTGSLRDMLSKFMRPSKRKKELETNATYNFSQVFREARARAAMQNEPLAKIWRVNTNWISAARHRFFHHQNAGLEIILDGASKVFVVVLDSDFTMSKQLRDECGDILKTQFKIPVSDKKEQKEIRAKAEQLWLRRQISNFSYLLTLNEVSSRTTADLTQYPVFPWVITEYTSNTLDLSATSPFRDLALPAGALNPTRAEELVMRFEEWPDPETKPFHHGTHYSTSAIVMHYLIREEPFLDMHKKYQGGKVDKAERLFHSVADAFASVMSGRGDVKELIAEWFVNGDIFLDTGVNLGTRQDGTKLGAVVLPPWAGGSAHRFAALQRLALESPQAREHLPDWIDLIFGSKQQGEAAEKAINLFMRSTYDSGLLEAMTSFDTVAECTAFVAQVQNFGLTPRQILEQPHPKVPVLMSSALSRQQIFLSKFAQNKFVAAPHDSFTLFQNANDCALQLRHAFATPATTSTLSSLLGAMVSSAAASSSFFSSSSGAEGMGDTTLIANSKYYVILGNHAPFKWIVFDGYWGVSVHSDMPNGGQRCLFSFPSTFAFGCGIITHIISNTTGSVVCLGATSGAVFVYRRDVKDDSSFSYELSQILQPPRAASAGGGGATLPSQQGPATPQRRRATASAMSATATASTWDLDAVSRVTTMKFLRDQCIAIVYDRTHLVIWMCTVQRSEFVWDVKVQDIPDHIDTSPIVSVTSFSVGPYLHRILVAQERTLLSFSPRGVLLAKRCFEHRFEAASAVGGGAAATNTSGAAPQPPSQQLHAPQPQFDSVSVQSVGALTPAGNALSAPPSTAAAAAANNNIVNTTMPNNQLSPEANGRENAAAEDTEALVGTPLTHHSTQQGLGDDTEDALSVVSATPAVVPRSRSDVVAAAQREASPPGADADANNNSLSASGTSRSETPVISVVPPPSSSSTTGAGGASSPIQHQQQQQHLATPAAVAAYSMTSTAANLPRSSITCAKILTMPTYCAKGEVVLCGHADGSMSTWLLELNHNSHNQDAVEAFRFVSHIPLHVPLSLKLASVSGESASRVTAITANTHNPLSEKMSFAVAFGDRQVQMYVASALQPS